MSLFGRLFARKSLDAQESPSQSADVPVKTLIGAGCVIEGDIVEPEGVKIDGRVVGAVTVDGEGLLIVSAGAYVEGVISARKAVIAGRVKGQICVTRLRVMASAEIDGNMRYATITMEDGARIRGMVQRDDARLQIVDGHELRSIPSATQAPRHLVRKSA